MQPSGVHGVSAGRPVASRPAFTGWKPSTSLAGSMLASTFWLSMCGGSGSCTRMPCTVGSPLSRPINVRSSASVVVAGRRWSNDRMPLPDVDLHLAADIDLARRIVADQYHGKPRHNAAVAHQAMHRFCDLAAQIGRNCLAVNNLCGHACLPGVHYPIAHIFSSTAASDVPVPAISSRLSRDVVPATSSTSRGATPMVFGDKFEQSCVRLAFACRRPHPHLQDAAPVRQLLDPLDGITPALASANRQRDAIRRDQVRGCRRALAAVLHSMSAHARFGE